MKYIAIHTDPEYGNSYSRRWMEYINHTDHYRAKSVDLKAANMIEQIENCVGVMWHYRHTPQDKQIAAKVLPAIENILKIPVWPDYSTRWHFDEKIAQHFLFQAFKIPSVKSWVFWDYKEAMEFLKSTMEYPFVFKLSVGAGAANIFKITTMEEGVAYLDRMFEEGIFPYTDNEYKVKSMEGEPNVYSIEERTIMAKEYIQNSKLPKLPAYYQLQKGYFYLQKFMPDNNYDIRITVIGNRAFGFMRYNRPLDFRASGSGLIDTDKNKIPLQAVQIAFRLSELARFQSMAYDFLKDENENVVINEISYCYVNKAVHMCPGYWDRDLVWHEGNMWPEQAHVEDFIAYMERKDR